jgi:hypothetical protein
MLIQQVIFRAFAKKRCQKIKAILKTNELKLFFAKGKEEEQDTIQHQQQQKEEEEAFYLSYLCLAMT